MTTVGWSRILTLPSELKAVTAENGARYVEGYASSGNIDRQNEVVNQKALLAAYNEADGVPYFRDHSPEKAIGHVVEWGMREGKVWTKARILPEGKSALADDLYNLLEIGTKPSQSIGFNPVDRSDWDKSGEEIDGVWTWGGRDGTRPIEILETSAVLIGANRDADLHMAKGLGLDLTQPWLDEDASLTKEEREEKRLLEDLTRAAGATEAARNYIRHLQREGRALSPETLEHVANPIANLAEVLRAGRVLSARNRTAVEAALDALVEVIARDDQSRARGEDAKDAAAEVVDALGFLDLPLRTSPFDLPLTRR